MIAERCTAGTAADFGLAFGTGKPAAELPPETEFISLLQDGDLNRVV